MIKLFGMSIGSIPSKDEDHQLSSSTTTTCIDTKDPTQANHGESVEQAKEEPTSEDPETSSLAINETSNSDDKCLEKPDKLLPCPRCSSMDTKFCYYNNYNVSQPRHFCKKCQRYWTAGGTMRSVPVGSGRRKNKGSPASRYRQIIVTEALQAARAGVANEIYQPNGSLLAFGSDSAQCENMCFEETDDDNSSGSSSTVLNPSEKVLCVKPKLKNIQESPMQLPCFPVPSWASPWNTAEWMSAFCPPFYPTPPYQGCTAPDPWNVRNPSSNCQILGKHSRDGSNIGSSNPEKLHLEPRDLKPGVLTPKTLRIHDPIEAAQSSIWSTLGIKNEHTKQVNEATLREASGTKGVQRYHMTKAAMVLQANPAALHRSYNFLETA